MLPNSNTNDLIQVPELDLNDLYEDELEVIKQSIYDKTELSYTRLIELA